MVKLNITIIVMIMVLTVNVSATTIICRAGVNCEENMAVINSINESLLEGVDYVEFTNETHPVFQGEYFYSYEYDRNNKITRVTSEKIVIYGNAEDKLWVLYHEVMHHLESKLFHGEVLSESDADKYADSKMMEMK